MKEVTIERIAVPWYMQYILVVLKEKNTHRRIPIGVGQQEGVSIIGALEHCPSPSPRPIPHDLLVTFVEKLSGTIRHVVVTKLHEEQKTFYATIVLEESDGSTHEVDARPSDALALAVRQNTPVFVEEALLDWVEKDDPSWADRDRLATVWPVSNSSYSEPEDNQTDK